MKQVLQFPQLSVVMFALITCTFAGCDSNDTSGGTPAAIQEPQAVASEQQPVEENIDENSSASYNSRECMAQQAEAYSHFTQSLRRSLSSVIRGQRRALLRIYRAQIEHGPGIESALTDRVTYGTALQDLALRHREISSNGCTNDEFGSWNCPARASGARSNSQLRFYTDFGWRSPVYEASANDDFVDLHYCTTIEGRFAVGRFGSVQLHAAEMCSYLDFRNGSVFAGPADMYGATVSDEPYDRVIENSLSAECVRP